LQRPVLVASVQFVPSGTFPVVQLPLQTAVWQVGAAGQAVQVPPPLPQLATLLT
jgi:hypothetical protein